MIQFTPGDKVRITAKGRRLLRDRGGAIVSDHANREVEMVHGDGRSQQVFVAASWWPASCWEKIA